MVVGISVGLAAWLVLAAWLGMISGASEFVFLFFLPLSSVTVTNGPGPDPLGVSGVC